MQVQQPSTNVSVKKSVQKEVKSDDIASLFSLYVSNEAGSRLPFTGEAINVGRTTTVITTTCSKLV
jgi:hypothetical protein